MRIPPCGNYGDINNDGRVTEEDALMAGKHYTGVETLTPAQVARADVDGDPGVTMGDAYMIGKYAAGAEGHDTFPVCERGIPPIAIMWMVVLGILYIVTR